MLYAVAALLLLSLPANAEPLPGEYPAELRRVIDGDTASMSVKVWPGWTVETHVRFAGIDAPELHRPKCNAERELAEKAKGFVQALLDSADSISLRNVEQGTFAGRTIAEVHVDTPDGRVDVGQSLIAAGLAAPYDGEAKPDWCRAK